MAFDVDIPAFEAVDVQEDIHCSLRVLTGDARASRDAVIHPLPVSKQNIPNPQNCGRKGSSSWQKPKPFSSMKVLSLPRLGLRGPLVYSGSLGFY